MLMNLGFPLRFPAKHTKQSTLPLRPVAAPGAIGAELGGGPGTQVRASDACGLGTVCLGYRSTLQNRKEPEAGCMAESSLQTPTELRLFCFSPFCDAKTSFSVLPLKHHCYFLHIKDKH